MHLVVANHLVSVEVNVKIELRCAESATKIKVMVAHAIGSLQGRMIRLEKWMLQCTR